MTFQDQRVTLFDWTQSRIMTQLGGNCFISWTHGSSSLSSVSESAAAAADDDDDATNARLSLSNDAFLCTSSSAHIKSSFRSSVHAGLMWTAREKLLNACTQITGQKCLGSIIFNFLTTHCVQKKTPTHVFFWIFVKNVPISTQFFR